MVTGERDLQNALGFSARLPVNTCIASARKRCAHKAPNRKIGKKRTSVIYHQKPTASHLRTVHHAYRSTHVHLAGEITQVHPGSHQRRQTRMITSKTNHAGILV